MTSCARYVLAASLLAASLSVTHAQENVCTPAKCSYLDATLPPEIRAADLVKRMTTEEKISQTLDHAKAIPRLGISEYNWWNEGLHGVARNGMATVFPQAIAMAATWDTNLVQRIGDTIATEARAKHNEAIKEHRYSRYSGLTYWSPNINIFRDPRWGRGQETYGEDPFLTASTGTAFIRGLQGDDPNYLKVVATPKHFAVHSGPEPSRHGFDAEPSAFDLEDTYLPAFRAAITEAHADSIMCAYNAIDHVPACASTMLLQTYLRDAWHFQGFVVSDCDAVDDVQRGHHYAPDAAHTSAVSLRAGTDLDCGSAYNALTPALQSGLLTESDLDTAVTRLFTARFRLGMFDDPSRVPYSKLSAADVNTTAHRQLALQAARESIVLLENKHATLPLPRSTRIAVVGPTADLLQAVEGNYQGTAPSPVLPLEGLRKQFGADHILYSPGSTLADAMGTPVPSTALHPTRNSTASGLKAEYFAKPDLQGAPTLECVDERINFNWDGVAPASSLPSRDFSVRWTGFLTLPAAGKYTLRFRGVPRPKNTPDMTGEGHQGASSARVAVRIFLDDKLVVDSSTGQASIDFTSPGISTHAIRVEYNRVSNDRYISLEWLPPAGALLSAAIEAAKASDVVVAFVGLSPDLEGEQMSVHVPGFNGGDRTSLDLPAAQQQLLEAMKSTGKPLVVVLTSGSALAVNWAQANADALLQAWYGGEDSGTAIADTLVGLNNPSGKLPVTFYRSASDLPVFEDYSMANRTYRYFKGKPLYPFGFGLSYSHFTYGATRLSKEHIRAGESIDLQTEVTNSSQSSGDEVVQVYVSAPGGRADAHPFLAGFTRVHLASGESKSVSIAVRPTQLSRVNDKGERSIHEGKYEFFVGGEQPIATGAHAAAILTVTGTQALPK